MNSLDSIWLPRTLTVDTRWPFTSFQEWVWPDDKASRSFYTRFMGCVWILRIAYPVTIVLARPIPDTKFKRPINLLNQHNCIVDCTVLIGQFFCCFFTTRGGQNSLQCWNQNVSLLESEWGTLSLWNRKHMSMCSCPCFQCSSTCATSPTSPCLHYLQ